MRFIISTIITDRRACHVVHCFGREERRLANAHDLPHGGAVLYGHADGSPRRTQSAAAIVTRKPHGVDASDRGRQQQAATPIRSASRARTPGRKANRQSRAGAAKSRTPGPGVPAGSRTPVRPRSRSRPRISAAERPEDVLSALHNIKTDRMLRKLDLFEEMDRDKDELVTADEVVSYLRQHHVEVEVETVVRLFEDITHDASQEVVNLHDFSVALGRHSIAKFDTPGKRLSQRSRRPAPRVRSAKRASRALAKTHPATHTQASGMTLGESPPHQPPLSPVNGLPSFPPDLSARRSYSSSHTAAGSGLSHADASSAALQAQLIAATGQNGLEELGMGLWHPSSLASTALRSSCGPRSCECSTVASPVPGGSGLPSCFSAAPTRMSNARHRKRYARRCMPWHQRWLPSLSRVHRRLCVPRCCGLLL